MAIGHRTAEQRSLRLHQAVACRLDPAVVDAARRRARQWRAEGLLHPTWANAWEELLSQPLDIIRARLVATDADAVASRQTTPFVVVLSARERWALLRDASTASP